MSQSSIPITSRALARSSQHAWPILAHIWLLMVPILVAVKVLLTPIAPYDFWWHIVYGRAIITTGHIPTTDQWSWTLHGVPYVDQPWLAQVLMYGIYQAWGAAGTQIVQALLVAGTYWLLRGTIEAAGVSRRFAALATLLAAIGAADNWHVRPQTYVLPLWVVTIALLDRWRRTGRTPWLLIPILALWANLHGTWTLPLALGGAFVVGEALRARPGGPATANPRTPRQILDLSGVLVLSGLATLANPHGAGLWVYTFKLLGNRAVTTLVSEWAKPAWGSASGFIVLTLFVLTAVATLARRQRLSATDLLALAPFALLCTQAVRNIIWFAAIAPVILAPLWQQARPAARRIESMLLNRLILGLLGTLLVLSLPMFKVYLNLPSGITAVVDIETPLTAVPMLEARPDRPRHLFNDMGFGSYIMWAAPEQPVFIDPRIEHYSYAQWQDYIQLGQGKNIDTIVARYGIDGFLLHKEHQEDLIKALRKDPRWHAILAADEAVLFLPEKAVRR